MARYTIGTVQDIPYEVFLTRYGYKAVSTDSVINNRFNFSIGNSKLGKRVLNYGMDIMSTCAPCECKTKGICYGTCGLFQMGSNLQRAAENFVFWKVQGNDETVKAIQFAIDSNPGIDKFRHFEIGDIPNLDYLKNVMVRLAIDNPGVHFWTYTKKYSVVNAFVDKYGLEAIPSNLAIIFSHWMNQDGSYYPMDNKYDFPTSEFIPFGKEDELLPGITHVCPCSDPDVVAHCEDCEHPCFKLQHGQSMALLEHSTKATAKRDKAIKAAHKAIEASEKEAKSRKCGKR